MESKIERVDDIPLLITEMQKSNLSDQLDEFFPDHGNWQGVSGGKVAVGFLTYVLSCSDHKLSHVEKWSAERVLTLGYCLNTPELVAKDFTDDRLGLLLDRYSNDDQWNAFEQAHNQGLINVHSLTPISEAIRLDAMITQSHRAVKGDFQFGYSKQHRSDLPQMKTMVATLDPLSMPLFSVTVAGNTADDVLYLPVIEELLTKMHLVEQLFVGDSKMGSLEIRSFLQKEKQYYLVPLSKKQCTPTQLNTYIDQQPRELTNVTTTDKKGKIILRAQAFELEERIEDSLNGIYWTERRIIVYSPVYAKRQQISLEDRILKAQNALALILQTQKGRKKLRTRTEVETAVAKILTKYQVREFLRINITERIEHKKLQKHKERPAMIRKISHFNLECTVNEENKTAQLRRLGWRAYACNAPINRLDTTQVVECYRNEYKIEHKFDELLNRITALMPVYLGKPNRIKALIRLLLLALKYVSLIEHQVRKELKTTKQTLKELYPGNPGRATNQPTTNMLLKAFKNIHLSIVSVGNKIYVKVDDLKPIQLKILQLLKIPPESYLGMNNLSFSQFDFSET